MRWNVGTIAAGTPNAGTVTITARAGRGDGRHRQPPQQTFTNDARRSRARTTDGTTFTAAASADVVVQALDITLGKSVDKTLHLLAAGHGHVHAHAEVEQRRRRSTNVRVIDPFPAGLTAPPVAVGQGGTFGAVRPDRGGARATTRPAGARHGDDGREQLRHAGRLGDRDAEREEQRRGRERLALRARGRRRRRHLHRPDAGERERAGRRRRRRTSSGRARSATSASTSSAPTRPTPRRRRAGPLPARPACSSAAGGGPERRHLEPREHHGRGAGRDHHQRLHGRRSTASAAPTRRPSGSTASTPSRLDGARANALGTVKQGGALTTDGAGTIYGLRGDGTQAFWAHDVATNTWTAKANTGTNVDEGGALVYLNVGGTEYVFATMGGNKAFRRYDVATNTWTALAHAPHNIKKGGALTTDGTNIYVLRGDRHKEFCRYNVAANTWTTLAPLAVNVGWGGSLTCVGGSIYALQRRRQEELLPLRHRRQHMDAPMGARHAGQRGRGRCADHRRHVHLRVPGQDHRLLALRHRRQHVDGAGSVQCGHQPGRRARLRSRRRPAGPLHGADRRPARWSSRATRSR